MNNDLKKDSSNGKTLDINQGKNEVLYEHINS